MEASELIASFGEYVDKHEATILVGAGLSLDAGYPDWSSLLERVGNQLQLPDLDDLPLLAQFYINEHSEQDLQDLIRQELQLDPPPQPTQIHKLLAQLPLAEIWTTNYDNLIESALGNTESVYVNDDDLARIGDQTGCRVYKIHGSLTNTEQPLIAARDQYIRYGDTHQHFWALLQASFLTNSFLILGFSFTDPNFDQVFRTIRRARHDIRRQHFAVMRKPSGEEDKTLFELQLKDLDTVGINVATIDNYSEMADLLKQLTARCRPKL